MISKRRCFSFILVACFLFSTESCGKSKTPAEKKAEPTVVRAVVAGQFYPADKATLSGLIDKYLSSANPQPINEHVFGIAVPHAGYQYSGPIAANAYKLIEGKKYSTVVVMAPSHQVGFEGIALTTKDFYETPLGKIPIAKELSQKLIGEFDWAKDDPRPYSVEHSLEVELPFLQTVLSSPLPQKGGEGGKPADVLVAGGEGVRLLPIIIGVCNSDMLKELASMLNNMFPGGDVLFVASTDLSHYHSYNDAVAKDKKTMKLIEEMNVQAFADAEKKGDAELCGSAPVETLMDIAKLRDGKAKIIKYANSGDTTGDKSRVVGYGAIVFVGGANPPNPPLQRGDNINPPPLEKGGEGGLSDAQKKTLLTIARTSIESLVLKKTQPQLDVKDPVLLKDGAAFVTLTKHGQLRGCIGHIIAMEPLHKSVHDNAIAAASEDPRFPPVAASELKDIELEISVLTPPQSLPNPMDVRVGVDGLIIQKGFHRGVLLPQVPTELGWSKERFLEGICEKAGLPPGSWKDANLSRFQAIVFHE